LEKYCNLRKASATLSHRRETRALSGAETTEVSAENKEGFGYAQPPWRIMKGKKKKIFIFFMIIFYLSAVFLYPAFDYKNISANSAGLGGIKTVVEDEAMAVLYNPALIGDTKKPEANFFYTKFYELDELAVNSASLSFPFSKGYLGFGYSSFGTNDFYKEETVAIAYKLNFLNYASLGVNYKILNLSLGEMNTSTNFYALDFAGKINCTKKTNFGFLLSNVNRPQIGKYYKEEIYRDFCVGYSCYATENVKLLLEYIKQVGYESDYRYAVETNILKKIFFRLGAQNNTNLFTFGFGIKNSILMIDYAYNYHFDLESQHLFTLKFYL
jgi:hypothetical protein